MEHLQIKYENRPSKGYEVTIDVKKDFAELTQQEFEDQVQQMRMKLFPR